MKRVSLVGTVHKEKGLASASALLAILERISPEVLFLEASSEASGDYLNDTGKELESATVSRYREIRHVDLVPVDLPIPDAELFQFLGDNGYLFKTIERRSPEYCRFVDEYSQEVRERGFAYLNKNDAAHTGPKFAKPREPQSKNSPIPGSLSSTNGGLEPMSAVKST